MAKQLARIVLVATAVAYLDSAAIGDAPLPVIAHWSFDTPTLTTSGGNITGIGDETNLHNMSPGSAVGSAGSCPCTSAAIPTSQSVTGQFGQGLTLTGNGTSGMFLTYPNLTELMTANSAPGAPAYTVSFWINTTATEQHNFRVFADWGLTGTNPGRFTYGYGFSVSGGGVAQMRAQSRNNTTGAGNGTDIFARADDNATLNNGSWHMLTWTFEPTGPSSGTLLTYFDGVLADTFNSTQNPNMILSSSPLGALGLKGDSGPNYINPSYTIDEAWVFNGVLTAEQIVELRDTNFGVPTNLSLQVNPSTGNVVITNPTESDISFSSYRITSSTGALNLAGWNPISNGNELPGEFPPDNGTSDGLDWEVAPNPSDNELVEWYLTGDSTLMPGQTLNLGNAFDVGGAQNLIFNYTLSDNTLKSGPVSYDVAPGVLGDFNGNGTVDAADYVLWRNGGPLQNEVSDPGTVSAADYSDWRARFGNTSGSGSSLESVPEPTSMALLIIAVLGGVAKRRAV